MARAFDLLRRRMALAVDGALFVTAILMIATEWTVLFFHLVFVLLSLQAFSLRLRPFVARAVIWVGITTIEVAVEVVRGGTQPDELVEIPLLTTILAIVFGIAARRERGRQETERGRVFLEAVLEHTADAVVATDERGTVVITNAAALGLGLGSTGGGGKQRGVLYRSDGVTPLDPDEQPLERALRGLPVRDREVAIRPEGSATRVFVVDAARMVSPSGDAIGAMAVLHDITERKKLEEALTHQALHDPLTGLVNRTLFRDRLVNAIARRRRQAAPFAVMFLDLDDFKIVNDSLGHTAGDALLVQVADRLRRSVRPADTVARLGGDEFALLIDALADHDAVTVVAGRIVESLDPPFEVGAGPVTVHGSIGVVVSDGTETADDLLRFADVAMYAAKGRGKGRYELFDHAMHDARMSGQPGR